MNDLIKEKISEYEKRLLILNGQPINFESDRRLIEREQRELTIRIDTLKSILNASSQDTIKIIKEVRVKRKRSTPFTTGFLDDSTESFESGYDTGFSDGQRLLRTKSCISSPHSSRTMSGRKIPLKDLRMMNPLHSRRMMD